MCVLLKLWVWLQCGGQVKSASQQEGVLWDPRCCHAPIIAHLWSHKHIQIWNLAETQAGADHYTNIKASSILPLLVFMFVA